MKKNKKIKNLAIVGMLATSLIFTATACGNKAGNGSGTQQPTKKLSGEVIVDGSSTVFPITEAVAEEFSKINTDVKVPVGVAGTGGGMKKFIKGEIDICDASRAIKDTELADAQKNGIGFTEFKIAYDGITVVVNKNNTWASTMTVDELKKVWEPESKIKTWKDIRPQWPNEPIKLYGPGTDSGTFEFFTEEIVGKKNAIRKDYTPSEDDNVLVQGIAGDKNAMGFFGYAYFLENQAKLKAIDIDTGSGAVKPSFDTIKSLTYKPLSRPLYIYVSNKAMQKEQVKEFVKFYLTEGTKIIKDVGYVPMDDYSAEVAKIK